VRGEEKGMREGQEDDGHKRACILLETTTKGRKKLGWEAERKRRKKSEITQSLVLKTISV
jgi:hypothetical protein